MTLSCKVIKCPKIHFANNTNTNTNTNWDHYLIWRLPPQVKTEKFSSMPVVLN